MSAALALVIALTQAVAPPEPGEVHFRNVRAEAYFSASGRRLIFQRQGPDEGSPHETNLFIADWVEQP